MSHIVIRSPAEGDAVAGQVEIRGSARVEDSLGTIYICTVRERWCGFLRTEVNQSYYKVEYRRADDPSHWMLIGDLGYDPVTDGLLAIWNTEGLPEGVYVLRLTIVDSTGNYWPPHEVQVILRRQG